MAREHIRGRTKGRTKVLSLTPPQEGATNKAKTDVEPQLNENGGARANRNQNDPEGNKQT